MNRKKKTECDIHISGPKSFTPLNNTGTVLNPAPHDWEHQLTTAWAAKIPERNWVDSSVAF